MSIDALLVNNDSVNKLTGNNREVMVYGFGKAWEIAKTILKEIPEEQSQIQRVYDCYSCDGTKEPSLLNGKPLELVSPSPDEGSDKYMKRICKNGLSSWALECWKRRNEQQQFPLIFALDTNHSFRHKTENMLTKAGGIELADGRHLEYNEMYTNSEIRRLYKLCTDSRVDPEVRNATRKNLIFVHVDRTDEQSPWVMKQVEAPWEENPGQWQLALAKRRELHLDGQKKADWREDLSLAVQRARAREIVRREDNNREASTSCLGWLFAAFFRLLSCLFSCLIRNS